MTHIEKFKIRTSECNKDMTMVPSAILDMFQEAAGRHSARYNVDSPSLIKNHNSTWVLSSMAMEVKKYPKWPDIIEVETWAKSLKGLKAFRDYRIYNENREIIANGSSIWALLDIEKRRPLRIDDIGEGVKLCEDNAMDVQPGKLPNHEYKNLIESEFIVTSGDIDMNDHVSNIKSLEWLYRELDQEFLKTHELETFNMLYRGEASLGDTMIFKSSITDKKGLHIFTNKETGRDYLSISASWREI